MEMLATFMLILQAITTIIIPITTFILVILILRNTSKTRKMTRRILQKMNGVQPTAKDLEDDIEEEVEKESGNP